MVRGCGLRSKRCPLSSEQREHLTRRALRWGSPKAWATGCCRIASAWWEDLAFGAGLVWRDGHLPLVSSVFRCPSQPRQPPACRVWQACLPPLRLRSASLLFALIGVSDARDLPLPSCLSASCLFLGSREGHPHQDHLQDRLSCSSCFFALRLSRWEILARVENCCGSVVRWERSGPVSSTVSRLRIGWWVEVRTCRGRSRGRREAPSCSTWRSVPSLRGAARRWMLADRSDGSGRL